MLRFERRAQEAWVLEEMRFADSGSSSTTYSEHFARSGLRLSAQRSSRGRPEPPEVVTDRPKVGLVVRVQVAEVPTRVVYGAVRSRWRVIPGLCDRRTGDAAGGG